MEYSNELNLLFNMQRTDRGKFQAVLNPDHFPSQAPAVPSGHEGGLWHAQLFRSISADSAHFDEERLGRLCRKEGAFFENRGPIQLRN